MLKCILKATNVFLNLRCYAQCILLIFLVALWFDSRLEPMAFETFFGWLLARNEQVYYDVSFVQKKLQKWMKILRLQT